jgi:gluconolactonase
VDLEPVAAGGFGLVEAPVLEPDGTAWFSDVTQGGIFRIAPGADAIDEVVAGRRGVGGMAVHAGGGVVASGRDVVRVHPDGRVEGLFVLEDRPGQPHGITGFNDLAVDAHGWIVVGALRFRPMQGEPPAPGRVVVIGDRFVAVAVDEGVDWPNGIGFAPDGRRCYVCDFAHGRVLAAAVDRQGAIAERLEPFARLDGADGLAVDADGGVWVATGAAGGLVRLDPQGTVAERHDGIATFVSSIAFGGPDGRDVLVTAVDDQGAGSLLRGRAGVAGVALTPATV